MPGGVRTEWLAETDSTNEEARRRALAGERGPLWIAARRQSAGRGRRGRQWADLTGNLYTTGLYVLDAKPGEAAQLSFAAALAAAEACEAVIDREVHFGLVVNPRPHPDIVMVDLFPDAVALFVATDRLAQAPGADDAERADHLLKAGPLVYAGRVMQCQQIIDELAEVGLLPQRMLNCGDLELVKSLTAGGTGVGVLPRRVAAYGQRGRLTPLPDHLPSIPDRIFLLFRGDLHRTRASRRLKDAIIAFGQALPTPTF